MDVTTIAPLLTRSPEGIFEHGARGRVSYPEQGHALCFQLEDDSFWFRHRNECIAAMVRANPPPPGVFLDVGGGNGFVARRLQDDGLDVVLVEPGAQGAINAHRARGIRHVVCASTSEAGFLPRSCAAIGLFDVVEHIRDDGPFMEHHASLLAPGGMLYLTVPCHGWLWSGADAAAGHFRRHTFESLRALITPHMDILYMSYFFQTLVLPQFLLRSLPYRLGMRRGTLLSTAAEHGVGTGALSRVLARRLAHEVARVRKRDVMKWGTSCLVAARTRARA